MKLSRTVIYAVQATLQLAELQAAGPVPCSRLATEGGMPERFLLQILRNLVTQGILKSTRGVDGGYSLDRLPQEISLLEVIEAIDGPFGPRLPELDGEFSAARQHRLREALDGVAVTVRRQLHGIKLSDLSNSPPRARLA